MTKTQSWIAIPVLGAVMLAAGAIAGYTGYASAQSQTGDTDTARAGFLHQGPHVGGEITALSGTILTVAGRGTTYTIDASGATIERDRATASLSDFAVGDHVHAEGTIDGSSVVATKIMGGMKGFGPGGTGGLHGKGPGVLGTVSAVDGSTITVDGMDGTTYMVDASTATVQKMVAGSLSDVAVGDRIGVQGTVSGTSVTATTIMDDIPERPVESE